MRSLQPGAFWVSVFAVCLAPTLARGEEAKAADATLSEEEVTFFESRIRPALIEHCYKCHSLDAKQRGGLRLDDRSAVRAGGDSGPAIVPGSPEKSLLIEAVRYQSLEMPPSGKLPDSVVADLVKWVAMGAPDPRSGARESESVESTDWKSHWAFQPIADPEPPAVADSAWPSNYIDRFILQPMEAAGLRPAEDADRYTWLRRISFDLTGLPPTLEEIRSFHNDDTPEAFERVADRLLASTAFGERWARHWLDLVGYADQLGTSNNLFSQHGWRYRDYVVDVFNYDKPFDRFIREQIAGDLLPADGSVADRADAVTATGFLLLGDLELVEADKAKLHVDIIDQQVRKVSKAFLGLTVGCARCHDHKFDPIPQVDYYAIGGVFHSTESIYKTPRGVWSDVFTADLPETEAQKAERAARTREHAAQVTAWKEEREQKTKRKAELDGFLARQGEEALAADERGKLSKERDDLNKRIGTLNKAIEHAEFFAPAVPRSYAVHDVKKPTNMRLTIRGNPRALGEEVERGFLTVVTTAKPEIPVNESGRRELADWIADPKNPLTTRVVVNRIWQKLFGVGLSRSVDYFGVRGETPTHPGLLDALATRFVAAGWSQKQLIRSVVLSRTYRMSSQHNEQAYEADPDNRLLWRMNRRRLDAEGLRDGLLAVSGQLQTSLGGSAMPLEYPENVNNIDPKNVNPPSFSLKTWRPEAEFQRTLYLPVLRSRQQPGPGELRNVFDFAQPARFTGQRAVTSVPTQALFLMNSVVARKFAQALMKRLEKASTEGSDRIALLWMLALNRPVTDDEAKDAEAFVAEGGDKGWVELCHAILASNEFLMRL